MATRKPRKPSKFDSTGEGVPPDLPKAEVVDVRKNVPPSLAQGIDEDGVPFARVMFSGSQSANIPFEMDVSFLLEFPHLLAPFVFAALTLLGTRPSLATVRGWRRELMGGFIPFLKEKSLTQIFVGDISALLIGSFTDWLNQERPDSTGARWDVMTRSKRWRALRAIIKKLNESKMWKEALHPTSNVRRSPWSGIKPKGYAGSTTTTPKKNKRELTVSHMTSLRLAAIKAVKKYMSDFAETKELVASARGDLKPFNEFRKGDGKAMSFAAFLAYFADHFETGEFSFDRLPTKLRNAIRENKFDYNELRVLFHPTARAIVPFVLLMTIAFFYNPATIRGAQLSDFEYDDVLNTVIRFLHDDEEEGEDGEDLEDETASAESQVLRANAMKRRAHKRQPVSVPVDSEPDNPAVLLEFVREWTKGIRKFAPTYWADDLFLFIAVVGNSAVKGFHGVKLHTDAAVWHDNLKAFCKEYGVERFTLDELRFTLVNMVLTEFEGDPIVAKIQGNHKHLDTTLSYGSDGTVMKQFEKLGHVMQLRTRHRENGVALDPTGRSSEVDPESATLGWTCLDIFDSPYTAKGKYCGGYGYCPKCELGTTDLTSPLCFAYGINLLDAVNRAQQTLRPAEWLERFGPVQKNLREKWLPSFSAEVQEEAKQINIPPMPTPE